MGSQYAKPPLEPMSWARNGRYPDAYFQAELADLVNKAAVFRLKEIASFHSDSYPASPGSIDERIRWRSAYRSSQYANCVIVKAHLAESIQESGAFAPYARVRIQTDAPATLGDAELHFGASLTETTVPSRMGVVWSFLMDGGTIAVPTANTEYFVTVSDFQSRIIACSIYEGWFNGSVPSLEGFGAGTPILDTDRQNCIAPARFMWKRQGAHLLNWYVDEHASPRTRTSATPINVIDNSSTAVSAATPGFTIDLRNRSTVRRGTVPVVFKSFAGMSADEGEVHLVNSAGSSIATITVTGAAAWEGITVDLPATLAKYDIHFNSNGSDTISLYAASLYQYETGT